jgi:hypothetical protein
MDIMTITDLLVVLITGVIGMDTVMDITMDITIAIMATQDIMPTIITEDRAIYMAIVQAVQVTRHTLLQVLQRLESRLLQHLPQVEVPDIVLPIVIITEVLVPMPENQPAQAQAVHQALRMEALLEQPPAQQVVIQLRELQLEPQ